MMNKLRLLRLLGFVAVAASLGVSAAASAGAVQEPVAGVKLTNASFSYVQARGLPGSLGSAVSQNVSAINFTKISAFAFADGAETSHRPEPEAWSMMILGAGFLVYQVRRRKRARAAWDLR